MFQWIAKLATRLKPSQAAVAQHAKSVESLEDRKLMSGSLDHGIVVNTLSGSNYNTVLKMLHDTNTSSVRVWASVKSFNSRSEDGTFKYYRRLHNDGIDITLAVVPNRGVKGSYDQVYNYFNWLQGKLGSSVSRWEIGNEVDMSYSGGLGAYVNQLLKPASASLHAHGEKVISGSVSWNPNDIKTLVNDGMLKYVDYVGYHPYVADVNTLKKVVSEVKSYVGGKGLVATEWNPRVQNKGSAIWNQTIKDFWPTIRDNFYGAYYYGSFKVRTMAGASGIMLNNSGAKNGQFYATYKGLSSGGGSGAVFSSKPITPPPAVIARPALDVKSPAKTVKTPAKTSTVKAITKTTTKSSTKKTPKPAKKVTAAVKPVVTGFRILDARTGKVLKGFENITSSLAIRTSALPTRYIQIEAITSNAGSIRFGFTGTKNRTENNAPFTAFTNAQGQADAWFASKGRYVLGATAYGGKNLSGTKGNKLNIYITFR
jgi:hypothetical protein